MLIRQHDYCTGVPYSARMENAVYVIPNTSVPPM